MENAPKENFGNPLISCRNSALPTDQFGEWTLKCSAVRVHGGGRGRAHIITRQRFDDVSKVSAPPPRRWK